VSEGAQQWLDSQKREPFRSLSSALQRRIIQAQLIATGLAPDSSWIELLRCNLGQPVSVAPGVRLQCDMLGNVSQLPEVESQFPKKRARLNLPGAVQARGVLTFGGLTVKWRLARCRSSLPVRRPGVELFDADQIGPVIEFGHWQPGDRFQPIGMATAVKLQDWFTNRKLPAQQRHRLVLAKTERGQVFWVEGERIGELAKVTPHTRRVLEWRWKRA
jgi:tRNA(Ile)-lysidine synthetase-like protein